MSVITIAPDELMIVYCLVVLNSVCIMSSMQLHSFALNLLVFAAMGICFTTLITTEKGQ